MPRASVTGTANGRSKGSNMPVRGLILRVRFPALVLGAVLAGMGCGALAALTVPQYSVSQKGREFHPRDLIIKTGETVQIVNDDGDLLHHAYIDSDKFTFDSGDQEPGSKTNIVFTVPGTFNVLCAIHPKMKLVVHVR